MQLLFYFIALCYKQTSPLSVPMYAFGHAPATIRFWSSVCSFCTIFSLFFPYFNLKRFKRSALVITDTELKDIAAAPIIGLKSGPPNI